MSTHQPTHQPSDQPSQKPSPRQAHQPSDQPSQKQSPRQVHQESGKQQHSQPDNLPDDRAIQQSDQQSGKRSDQQSGKRSDQQSNQQAYELRPDWKVFLLPYIAGVLLIPVAGLGIYIIYRYWSKWKTMRYVITNSEVIHQHGDNETIALLHEIVSCEVSYSRLTARFGIGTITIGHTAGSVELNGITDPEPVAELIERAAAEDRERMKMQEEAAQYRPPHPSGTLDKKNELVGLWQQGLISEEDYQQELKKFES